MQSGHADSPPSPWIARFGRRVDRAQTVLDLACGTGRHARFFAARGHTVLAVDRDPQLDAAPGLEVLTADLESGPLPDTLVRRKFGCVVVANYLHRPLLPWIAGAVEAGGWLLYETFAVGNERYGHPRNPNFLLKPGELLGAVWGELTVVAYEHGLVGEGSSWAVIQRIAAQRTEDVPLL